MSAKPIFIAGPCVIETMDILEEVATELVRLNMKFGIDIIFKSSFDKANRTSLSSFRGPGLEKGLQMLADIKAKYGLKIVTDIHESFQAQPVGEVADVHDNRTDIHAINNLLVHEIIHPMRQIVNFK